MRSDALWSGILSTRRAGFWHRRRTHSLEHRAKVREAVHEEAAECLGRTRGANGYDTPNWGHATNKIFKAKLPNIMQPTRETLVGRATPPSVQIRDAPEYFT